MDIGVWLRSLNLGRYETTFRDNSIGLDVLLDLTGDDLEKLGVTLGDRKRVLKAIASLGEARTAEKPTSRPSRPSSTDAAERRQLTTLVHG